MDPAHLERLLDLARDLFAARSDRERAVLGAEAGAEVLAARGVSVQLYRPDGVVHAHAGPEMSADLRRRRLGQAAAPLGEVVVEGADLAPDEQATLRSLVDTLTAAVEADQRQGARRRVLQAGLRVAAGLASERDAGGPAHVERRAAYAREIGAGLCAASEDWLDEVELAALLSGVGRAELPLELLRPGRPLTEAERALVAERTARGARVLGAQAGLRLAAEVARDHGTRWDASDDPNALCLAARVIALADAYEELTRPAPHGAGRPHGQALSELAGEAGARFDPRVVEAFLARAEELDALRRRAPAAATARG